MLPTPRRMSLKRVAPPHISVSIGIVQRGSKTSQACEIGQINPYGLALKPCLLSSSTLQDRRRSSQFTI